MIFNIYTIAIGNAVIVYSNEPNRGVIEIKIELDHDEDCIDLGFMDTTTNHNKRMVSVSNFSKLLKGEEITDVYDMFMGETGFFRTPEDAKCYPINEQHLDIINNAIELWESNNPNCKNLIPYKGLEPSNFTSLSIEDQIEVIGKYDWIYSNLLWLRFWFNKSISEFDYPAILIQPMV